MKKPREILFERHRGIQPRLDAVRQRALAAARTAKTAATPLPHAAERPRTETTLRKAWRELIWPFRIAWAGIAVLWVGILGADLEMKGHSPATPMARVSSSRETANAFKEQQQLLAELLAPARPSPVPTQQLKPGRRSDRSLPFKATMYESIESFFNC